MSFTLSHHSHLLLPLPRNTSAFLCIQSIGLNKQDQTHNWNGLKFIRGKKLLKDLSTWGIGGPCNYFVETFDQTQLVSALRVGSGFPFNRLGVQCSNDGFTGLEFAGGIPGTVGGATYMNAGANGQETAKTIDSVDIVTVEGKFQTFKRIDLDFGYRSSTFQDMKNLAAIVGVTFRLQGSGSARRQQEEYLERRRRTQPVGKRSAGSVFRNPSHLGVAAAGLIEKAGLKGLKVGGAMVSNIHANFFINCGGSTSQDMLDLIALVKEKVDQTFGIQLEEEILYFHPCGFNPNRDK